MPSKQLRSLLISKDSEASRMFCLWICLSLLYALQGTVSSDQAVSLLCNNTVEVKVGADATLNCAIIWKEDLNCRLLNNSWRDTNGPIPCENNRKYICKQDPLMYVSLTIRNVLKEEKVTVEITSDCGMEKSFISVHLLPGQTERSVTGRGKQEKSHVMTIILCVFATATLVSIFSV